MVTSYHAGMIAKYWFEQLIGVPCQVEIASEFRYRSPVIVTQYRSISVFHDPETADTLAALRETQKRAKTQNLDMYHHDHL